MFYVPRVGDDSVVLKSDFVGSRSKDLVDEEWPLPQGCELVAILATLNSSGYKISDSELAGTHVALMVAPQGLLVSGTV
jgi:hypothetical protein